MNDEQLLRDLILLSGLPCEEFCKKVLDKTIKVDVSRDNYIFLTLILMKYLNLDFQLD